VGRKGGEIPHRRGERERDGKKEGGDEGEVFIVMPVSIVPSPGNHGGCGGPPRKWCGLAQLRSQQLLTNSDINKQFATQWMTIGVDEATRGIGGVGRGGVEWGC
jgi:hypothetical protein